MSTTNENPFLNMPIDFELVEKHNLDPVQTTLDYLGFEKLRKDLETKHEGKLSRLIFEIVEQVKHADDYWFRQFFNTCLMLPFDVEKLSDDQLKFLHKLQRYTNYKHRMSVDAYFNRIEEKRLSRLN